MANTDDQFKKVIAHAKEYGFIFPSSEIYDGLGAVYDYGQNGVELKKNIREYWWRAMMLLFLCTLLRGRLLGTWMLSTTH